jgi:uncharacterized protein (TIGR03435 family)
MLVPIDYAHSQIGAAQGDPVAHAIATAAALPPYDVVSVKQNNTGDGNFKTEVGDDTFSATNVQLLEIVEEAYDIKEDMISGLSGPVTSIRFDIEAKALPTDNGTPRKLADKQLEAMLIPLLTDRFHLKAHLQLKTLPVYELTVSRSGPKIQFSQIDGKNGSASLNRSRNDVTLTARQTSTTDLADMLSDEVHRKVIDKTGLKGFADITLKWTADDATDAGDEHILSIFTAIQEQLGLKLQPSKGPVETLVIDHVEMPSQN